MIKNEVLLVTESYKFINDKSYVFTQHSEDIVHFGIKGGVLLGKVLGPLFLLF